MTNKTYTNKSNAARAAKKANGGTLNGLTLLGKEGAWYYAPEAAPVAPKRPTGKARVPVQVTRSPGIATMVIDPGAFDKPAPAAPAAKVPAKKAAKKAVSLGRTAAVKKMLAEEYDVKHGPTQGRIRGYHIDTDRDERHGVKRRSAGTIGGRLWAIYAAMSKAAGGPEKLEIAAVKEHPQIAPFNKNKVLIEFYCWRRYMGVRGRGNKQKVDK